MMRRDPEDFRKRFHEGLITIVTIQKSPAGISSALFRAAVQELEKNKSSLGKYETFFNRFHL